MSNTKKIAILMGDGIGPETMAEGIKVLKVIEARNEINFDLVEAPFGASAWFSHGSSFPDETKKLVDEADAVIKGPIGLSHEESKQIPIDEQPERGALLPMRARMNTYANYRPVFLPKSLGHFSPLKPEIVGEGIDIIMVRELFGGVYFGKKVMGVNDEGKRFVTEALEYDEDQIRQILVKAFELAQTRKKVLHNIHKSNVLKSSVLWNEILDEVKVDYADVEVIHMLVDAASTALCLRPTQFDVMVMENMFGDILSDAASVLPGSLGLMPSLSIGEGPKLYEPSGGSAPDIAGKGIANPAAQILCGALMMRYTMEHEAAAKAIEDAVDAAIASGVVTGDVCKPGQKAASTVEFGDAVVKALK